MGQIVADMLRQEVDYDPATGVFTWVRRLNGRRAGAVGSLSKRDGYRRITIGCRAYLSHRLAWMHVHGSWPDGEVDHINGDRSDNRLANLRDVPKFVNMQNMKRARADSVLQVMGVYQHKNNRNFVARIKVSGRSVHLGCFDSPSEASAAYLKAKRKFHEGCTL